MNRHYKLLHLRPGASAEQIHQAYLDLARVWGPDRFVNDERLAYIAAEKMAEITAAYQALTASGIETSHDESPLRETSVAPPLTDHHPTGMPSVAGTQATLKNDRRLQLAGGALLLALALGATWIISRNRPSGLTGTTVVSPTREAAVEHRTSSKTEPQRAADTESAGRQASQSGVGEIQINNRTDSTAVLRIRVASARENVLNTATVPAGDVAMLRNLSSESYLIEVTFSDGRSPPLQLGPFPIREVTTAKAVEADRYEITLRPAAR